MQLESNKFVTGDRGSYNLTHELKERLLIPNLRALDSQIEYESE